MTNTNTMKKSLLVESMAAVIADTELITTEVRERIKVLEAATAMAPSRRSQRAFSRRSSAMRRRP